MAVRIILLNVAVLVIGRITGLILTACDAGTPASVFDYLAMPPTAAQWLQRPWTAVTYMFTQEDVWHAALNMLWLYAFATIFRTRCTSRQLLALYLIGGWSGAALYALTAYTDPTVAGAGMMGASASVLAVATATAILLPDFQVRVFLLGMVRIKWIALLLAIMFLAGNSMSVTAAATHAAGIAAGAFFALQMRRGIDITAPLNRAIDAIVNAISHHRHDDPWRRKAATPPRPTKRNLDDVIEKIRRSGYSSLTDDEKRRFFDFTNRRN